MEDTRISISEERYKELLEKEVRIDIVKQKLQSNEYYTTKEVWRDLGIDIPEKDEK